MDVNLSSILNHLILELRTGKSLSPGDLVDRGAFYLPTLRNVNNVSLLLAEMLFSPSVLGDGQALDFNLISRLIDGLQYSVDRKHKITDPLISFSDWVSSVVSFSRTIAPEAQWRLLPLISALGKMVFALPYNPNHKQMQFVKQNILEILNEVIPNSWPDHRSLVVFSLARAQPEMPIPTGIHIVPPAAILEEASHIVYKSSEGIQMLNPDLLCYKYYNGFSILIRECVIASSPQSRGHAIGGLLNNILSFTEKLQLSSGSDLTFSKISLFGLLIQFEGVANRMLQKVSPMESSSMAKIILVSLSCMNEIVLEIGRGGFEQYSYVYYLCLDTLMAQPAQQVDSTLEYLIGYCQRIEHRLVFLLDLFESIILGCSDSFLGGRMVPFVQQYLKPVQNRGKYAKEVLESAHSVMLQVLVLKPNLAPESLYVQYFETATDLFPGIFTSRQFVLALNKVFETIDPSRLDLVMERLFFRCKTQLPGIPLIEEVTKSEDTVLSASQSTPRTIRAALVQALLCALPHTTPEQFSFWLQRLLPLIRPNIIYNELVEDERAFLVEKTWDMICNELSPQLQSIGISWWYDVRNHKL